MNAQAEQYYHPVVLKDYGLKQGDRLKIRKGAGTVTCNLPDYVEVIEEYPAFILCNYVYKHWQGHLTSYRHCLNKVLIAIGDIAFTKKESAFQERARLSFTESCYLDQGITQGIV